ncbi:murein DD-endopeptidase MepM/ murein hydrolase activator NlpD [Sphingobium wenxiniae]|uniref:Peptidase M23-like protein n=1 Tax=Sphingobium wenxiniae (strain DSM 21828 / CGMCC 1.7748 / JZ-1) TaxID=595605 RepID=A0A562KAS2_SPHWJ|nr:M23 family metallopeptidase [Sphingobium wenxiniae]MBB6192131.1 murein DD-endopeptidase MepM/ murein hydrolase activator NlpD [Sphingobium wenxiniae]TWH92508.1 peptidase M23-like protein [Sphingobium wenxiniae]
MKFFLAAAAILALAATAAPSAPPLPAAASDFRLSGEMTQGGALRGTAPPGTVDLRLDGRPVPVESDGRFLIAFDRDAGPQARLTARLADGRVMERPLTIAPRAWRLERINAPMRPTKNTEAFMAIRKPELDRIAAARATITDAQGWRQTFIWPRRGRISGLFGAQRIYQGTPAAYHSGVDVAGATGEPVVAPAGGVVILAADRPFTLEGNLLMIDHGHGLNSAFLHLSRIDVKAGDKVRQGQMIGAIGATGRATGPHLHWSMKWNDARIDPLLLAGAMPSAE